MSSYVKGEKDDKVKRITLTRGDTLQTQINILQDDKPYEPQEGDEITFSVKRNKLKSDRSDFVDEEPVILKTVPNDTLVLTLDPPDTKGLAFDTYTFEVELKCANGKTDTFISEGVFTITKEVH